MAKKQISSLSVVLGATTGPFVRAFSRAGDSVTRLTGKVRGAGASILKLTGIAAGIGAAFAAIKGAASGITLAAQLEQVGVAFETMLGSAGRAKALMDDLVSFSAATPFEFPEIASSAKQLLAFGVGAEDMTNKLRMLGDVAAGVGAPLEDIAAIYGKVKARGQLTGESLNQMAQRGIPIYKALAKEMGVAETEVAGLVSKGQVGFKQVDAALAALTATGGQFSGMMAKQSTTMAGLWSTLTDNIGLGVAGLVTTLVEAFDVRGLMSRFISTVQTVGDWLNSTLTTWAPIVINTMRQMWAGIISVWSSITSFLQPLIAGITTFAVDNWRGAVDKTTAIVMSLANLLGGVFSGIWTLIKTVGEGIMAAWGWAMQMLGVQTDGAATTFGSIFQTIAEAVGWLADQITFGVNVMAWAFAHWRDLVDLAVVGVIYQVVKVGNEIAYWFTEVIPGYLSWFAGNWRDILTTIWDFYSTVFTNIWKNVGNFFKGLWSLIKGKGFNFEWTGLTEGFKSTIKELPKIAKREIGPLEKTWGDAFDQLSAKAGGSLNDYLAQRQKEAQAAGKSIRDAITGLGTGAPQAADIKPPAIDFKTNVDMSGIDALDVKTQQVASELKSLFAGSAEAQLNKYQAQFSAKLAASSAPKGVATAAKGADARAEVQKKTLTEAQKQTALLTRIAAQEANLAVAEF